MRLITYLVIIFLSFILTACNGDTAISSENGHTPPAPAPADPIPDTPQDPNPSPNESEAFELPVTLEKNQVIIFYNRADGDYEGWGLHLWNTPACNALADSTLEGVVWQAPFLPTGIDADKGAYFVLDTVSELGCFNLIVHKGDEKALGGGDIIFNSSQGKIMVGNHETNEITYPADPTASLAFTLNENQAAVVYKREDGIYDGWGLHLWNSESCGSLADSTLQGVEWLTPKLPTAIDDEIGAYFILDLSMPQGCFNFIVHKGDERGFGSGDLIFDLTQGNIIFGSHGSSELRYSGEKAEPLVNVFGASAHLVDASTLVWGTPDDTAKVEIRSSLTADISVNNGLVEGGDIIQTENGVISNQAVEKFPHLAQWNAYALNAQQAQIKAALGGQLVALAYDQNDNLIAATRIQTAGAIDELFATDEALGAIVGANATSFKVWAPTAQQVRLLLWDDNLGSLEGFPAAMTNTNGVWSLDVSGNIENYFYQYEVTVYHYATGQIETTRVTDPYSLSLSTNSVYSQVVSLDSEQTKPSDWDDHLIPTVSHPEKTVVYETHIRDFSAQDESISIPNRGKYLAFSETSSVPVSHLKSLQQSGLTHIHLLPSFDITTVNEDAANVVNLQNTVQDLCAIKSDSTICENFNSFILPGEISLTQTQAVIFYKRDDESYDDWGLHLWNDENCNALADSTLEGVEWATPLLPAGVNNNFGAYFILETINNSCINFILHKGDEKALGEANSRMELVDTKIALTEHGNAAINLKVEGDVIADTRTLKEVLESFDPATNQAQAFMNDLRQVDSFNWGYDPFHFTTPEGSYASDANGVTRIKEFREMVKAIHQLGLRVVMDVVYNHTSSSGLSNTSVLDKIVPGYYHRLNEISGNIERSSCCENTASEHDMMEKLMIDSLVVWARDYKIDGFRFDLMGHHMVRNMEKALAAVQAIDADNYFYGEAWNFGEVIDSRRGKNAIQKNVGGTGIGTFNDRIRDAVRGGGPFDSANSLRRNQGFGTGLYHYPNEMNSGSDQELADLKTRTDWIRLSLAGNLENYMLETASGDIMLGSSIDYQGQNAGYTQDPQENVNYISKHDNQTLWDNLQYKVSSSLSSSERTRMQNFSLSVPMLAQGVVFMHMGVDVLRSKSMQRDSFDSGDWFNRVDFSGRTHNWNIGLPREDKDGDNYGVIRSRLTDMNAKPSPEDIDLAKAIFKEWLEIRSSSALFSLQTAKQVNDMLTFHNTGQMQVPGVIVMKLNDSASIDPENHAVVVVFNASNSAQTMPIENSENYRLHNVQQTSADMTTRSSSASEQGLYVPALTTAVFVLPQDD